MTIQNSPTPNVLSYNISLFVNSANPWLLVFLNMLYTIYPCNNSANNQ